MDVQSIEKNCLPAQQDARSRALQGGKSPTPPDLHLKLSDQTEPKDIDDQRQKLVEAVEQTNKTMETYNTALQFSIHEESGEIMVRVIDTRDDSVIREIPPARILDFVANVKRMLGLILDKLI